VAGCGAEGAAGGVYLRASRLPRDYHLLDHRVMVLVRGEISSSPWWSPEHRRRIRRVGGDAVVSGVPDRLRVSPGGRDIGVDSLATELVIDRRLAHGRHRRGAPAGAASTRCAQVETLCG
jgi:hypothetical protein